MPVETSAFNAAGTTLGYKIGSASVYTNIAQLVEFEESGISIDPIETTLLASTIKTYIAGIPDPGEITLTVYNVPGDAGVAALKGLANTGTTCSWQVQYPDGSSPTTGTTETFSGFVMNFGAKGFTVNDTPTAEVTIKISGLITTTTGT